MEIEMDKSLRQFIIFPFPLPLFSANSFNYKMERKQVEISIENTCSLKRERMGGMVFELKKFALKRGKAKGKMMN